MDPPPQSLAVALQDLYRVECQLGRGGMAEVYLAQDLRHDRPVALKVMRPELSGLLGRERFMREIEIASRLQHPSILPLFDSGSADGSLFYVMPFVEGETLRELIDREKQLGLDDVLAIAQDVGGSSGACRVWCQPERFRCSPDQVHCYARHLAGALENR